MLIYVLAAIGVFFVLSSIFGFVLLKRRKKIEQLFTLYSSAGRWEEALPHAILLAHLKADPITLGRRRQNLGNVYLKLARWDEAREAFARALETQLKSADAGMIGLTRTNLAWLELRSGQAEKAREHARAIEADAPVELKPRAQVLFAASHLVDGAPEKARALLEPREAELKASRKPGDAVALAVLAAALEKQGERERALELGRAAAGRMPSVQRREFVGQAPFLASVLGG